MQMLVLVLVLLLNVGISFWNARVVGLMWNERKAHGTFMYLVLISALVQSVIGFSMPILLGEAALFHSLGYLSDAAVKALTQMWYLAIIFPALGTGTIITAHSLMEAYRERNFANMATATYNTFAMGHNIYQASSGIGEAFSGLSSFFKSSSDDEDSGAGLMFVLLAVLVGLSLLGGGFITYGIVQHYKGKLAIPARQATA